MKQKIQRSPREAFTIIELLVVIVVLALLCCLAVPGMAKAKTRSPAVGCLSNLRQLMVGWASYAEENSGILMSNAPVGVPTAQGWCGGSESWSAATANIDPAFYTNALMGPYLSGNVGVLTCPGDVIPSANGRRIRSYSMNGQMGSSLTYAAPYRNYLKESDLTCPVPKDAFIFCDESPFTLNDGYLQLNLNTPGYPDLPASYLEGGCGFGFADGHGEIHKWRGPFIQVPVVYGLTSSGPIASSGADPDWLWLKTHSACLP